VQQGAGVNKTHHRTRGAVGFGLHETWAKKVSDEDGSRKEIKDRSLYETWVPVADADTTASLSVPPPAMPNASGENFSLRWEIIAAGERDSKERIARRPLRVDL
jgi:hypothetical protein